jgi:hypothetical protein
MFTLEDIKEMEFEEEEPIHDGSNDNQPVVQNPFLDAVASLVVTV